MSEKSSPGVEWYYFDGHRAVGPFSWPTLLQLHQGGLINDETPISRSDDQDWRSFGSVEPVRPALSTDLSRHDSKQDDQLSTVEEGDAAEFSVRFGSNFIPASGGFRGPGMILISEKDVEIRGHFALPLFVEFLLCLGLICGFLVGGMVTDAFIPRIAFVMAAVASYRLTRRRRRFDRTQIREPICKGSAVILVFRPGARQSPVTVRAFDAAAAEEMVWLIRRWPEGVADRD